MLGRARRTTRTLLWPPRAAQPSKLEEQPSPQTHKGEKLLLPNRLSSFSHPALQQGRAVQELSPAHPSLG